MLLTSCSELIIQSPESDQNIEDFEIAWDAVNDVYPVIELLNHCNMYAAR